MWLNREIYKSELAQDAILAAIKAKGRKMKDLDRKVQDACNSLSAEAGQELYNLYERIMFSYNYRKIRLKAVHNQRDVSKEARAARVASFIENNPEHYLVKQSKELEAKQKFNYWSR